MSSETDVGPWTQYQNAAPADGPWAKYRKPASQPTDLSEIIRGKGKKSSDEGELPFHDQVVLDALDKDEERQVYLERAYGKGSVSKDKKGFVVTVGGKKLRPGEGFWTKLGASLVADAPETVLGMAGATEGAGIGSPAGPVGMLGGALVGAGAGAMAGKSVKETVKSIAGLQRQKPGELTGSVGLAGESGVEGEFIGRGAGKVIGRLTRGPLPRFVTSTTPETEAMTERLVNRGARPHPQSTMPSARHIQRVAIIADKVSGPSKSIDRANIGYLQDQMHAILTKARVPQSLRDDVIRRLQGAGDSAISFQSVGKSIQNAAIFMIGPKGVARAKTFSAKDEAILLHLREPNLSPEDAYSWLTAAGETDRLERFFKLMGRNSQVVENVQFQALRNILSGAMVRSATGEATEALEKEMGQFTEKQQKLLFPGGLDGDIKTVAKEIQFLYPKIKDPAMAGFKAGTILGHIWYNRWWAQATYSVYRGLLQKPATIRRLAVGFKGTSAQRTAARNALKAMIYFGALEMNQPKKESAPSKGGTGAAPAPTMNQRGALSP